jgi:hypothetical protein
MFAQLKRRFRRKLVFNEVLNDGQRHVRQRGLTECSGFIRDHFSTNVIPLIVSDSKVSPNSLTLEFFLREYRSISSSALRPKLKFGDVHRQSM